MISITNFFFVVGYAVTFICFAAGFWTMGLERPLAWLSGSMVWMSGMWLGLFLVQSCEVKRLRLLLKDQYPKHNEKMSVMLIAAAIAAIPLFFLLK